MSLALLALGALAACGIEVEGSVLSDAGPAGSGGVGGVGGVGADASGGSAGLGGGSGGGAQGGAGGVSGAGTCSGSDQCVPAAPTGWSYAFLAGGTYAASAPPGAKCWDGSEPVRYYMDPVSQADCTPCSCAPLTGGSCTMPMVCSSNSTCTSFQDFTRGDTDCHGSTGSAPSSCMFGGATIVSTGSCAPSGGQLASKDPWKQLADFCPGKSSGACGAGSACVPHGAGPYDGYVCVYAPGEQTCPADYAARSVIYKQMTDTRACGACNCTPSKTACLGGEYEFFDDALCGAKSLKVNGTTCTDVTPAVNDFWLGWSYKKKADPGISGSCDASGGTPSGGVVGNPSSGLTMCCRSAG